MVSMNGWQSPPTLLPQCSCRYDDDTTVKNCNDRTDCSASAFAGALRVVDNQHSEASATAFTRCQQRAHPHTSIMCALRKPPCLTQQWSNTPLAPFHPAHSLLFNLDYSLTRGGTNAEGDGLRHQSGASHV